MDDTTTIILDAARDVFGQRGFAGTSIRAIADAAGVSRPTVYARYKNKEAIFRAVYQRTFDAALASVQAALQREAPLGVRLGDALYAFFGTIFAAMRGLEQAQDLLAQQERVAGDIVLRAQSDLRAALRDALSSPERIKLEGVSLDELVELLLLAAPALKGTERDPALLRARLQLLAQLVAHAVTHEEAGG
ncbi:MAG: AcrR family transcriptional regulator [Myxococcota bacterium]|jgi:AcrR family transcriptional regulator